MVSPNALRRTVTWVAVGATHGKRAKDPDPKGVIQNRIFLRNPNESSAQVPKGQWKVASYAVAGNLEEGSRPERRRTITRILPPTTCVVDPANLLPFHHCLTHRFSDENQSFSHGNDATFNHATCNLHRRTSDGCAEWRGGRHAVTVQACTPSAAAPAFQSLACVSLPTLFASPRPASSA